MAEDMNIESKRKIHSRLLVIIASIIVELALLAVIVLIWPQSVKAGKVEESLKLGDKYLAELEYEQAIAAYLDVIQIDPKCEEAYVALADIYVATGNYEEAEKILEKAKVEVGSSSKVIENKTQEVEAKKTEYVERFDKYDYEDELKELMKEETPQSAFEFEIRPDRTAVITGLKDKSLTQIHIPDKVNGFVVTNIVDSTFSGCDKLVNVVLPDSLIWIGNEAFKDCTSLKTIVVPTGVIYVGKDAFKNCKALESVKLPFSITKMENAFDGCDALEVIFVQEGSYVEKWLVERDYPIYHYVPERVVLFDPDSGESRTYIDDYSIAIDVSEDSDWVQNEYDEVDSVFVYKPTSGDEWDENIVVTTVNAQGFYNDVELCGMYIDSQLVSYGLQVSSTLRKIGEYDCYEIFASGEMPGMDGTTIEVMARAIIIMKDDVAYTLIFNAEKDDYAQLTSWVDEIFNSFRIEE